MILDRGDINRRTCALVAYGIAVRIVGLHKIGLTQRGLVERDVLVNKSIRTVSIDSYYKQNLSFGLWRERNSICHVHITVSV